MNSAETNPKERGPGKPFAGKSPAGFDEGEGSTTGNRRAALSTLLISSAAALWLHSLDSRYFRYTQTEWKRSMRSAHRARSRLGTRAERPATCLEFEHFTHIELSPMPGEFSAKPSERDAERGPTRASFECSKGPRNTRANACVRHCFLAISCPEPGGGGGGERPAFRSGGHPRGAAEPPRFGLGNRELPTVRKGRPGSFSSRGGACNAVPSSNDLENYEFHRAVRLPTKQVRKWSENLGGCFWLRRDRAQKRGSKRGEGSLPEIRWVRAIEAKRRAAELGAHELLPT